MQLIMRLLGTPTGNVWPVTHVMVLQHSPIRQGENLASSHGVSAGLQRDAQRTARHNAKPAVQLPEEGEPAWRRGRAVTLLGMAEEMLRRRSLPCSAGLEWTS